ncbi:hypothetical protein Tco_0915349 [Tanacetum coccineum]
MHLKSHSSSIKTPSCGNDAHYGYNCPPKVPIISNPEPCNNQTVDELPQTLPSFYPTCYSGDGNSFTYDSTPNFVNDSPNVSNPPPQPLTYSYEFCGNDTYYGYDCSPQVPFIYNPEPCYNQDFNFPQNFQSFQQQYLCCENYGGPHATFECQPMNKDYYRNQNSCYDPNSFGFDQFQPSQYTVNHPILNGQNELLNSQNEIMEQMISICDMIGQYMQKKEEEKRIAKEQAAKNRYWKIPICYDDDDDEGYTIAITPDLSTEEPDNSLSMEDEHLDTILETESDEVIKSSVEDLVPIPSESKGIPDKMCDVPFCDNSPPLDISKDQFEGFSDSNDDSTSIDDDSFSIDDINYVEASPPDSELVSLVEVKRIVSAVTLSILIISSGCEAFLFLMTEHIESKSSGLVVTTTHSDISLSKYDSFIFNLSNDPFSPAHRSDFYHEEFADELAHIISPPEIARIFEASRARGFVLRSLGASTSFQLIWETDIRQKDEKSSQNGQNRARNGKA